MVVASHQQIDLRERSEPRWVVADKRRRTENRETAQ
jgi:hypothetical protein